MKKYIKAITDHPITPETKQHFLDRETEILELSKIIDIYEGLVIGVTGERGIGKTSIFNILEIPNQEKIIIHILNRDSKMGVLFDIVVGLTTFAENRGDKKSAKIGEKIIDIITKSEDVKTIGFNYFIEFSDSKTHKQMFKFGRITNELKKLIDSICEKTAIVVILDEIDKESKKDILLIIDAIKYAFLHPKATLVVSLPASIYEEYISSKHSASETYNLENIFAHITYIHPMTDSIIAQIINMLFPLRYIEEKAKQLIIFYANGNPRKAKLTLKESGLNAILTGSKKIRAEHVKYVIKKYMKNMIYEMGKKDWVVLTNILPGKKADNVKKISKIMKTTPQSIYKYLDKLEGKGYVIYRNGNIELSRLGILLKEVANQRN